MTRHSPHALELSHSHSPNVPHLKKTRKIYQTTTRQVGQRHVTGMSGSCSSKLDGKLLPSCFGI